MIINDISITAEKKVLPNDEISRMAAYFNPSSTQLTNESLETLDSVLLLLDGQKFNKILISGYADTSGSFALNRQIAEARALAVKKYLIENGFSSQKIETTSKVLEIDPLKFKSNRRVNFKVE